MSGWNLGSHACKASSFSTELFAQLASCFSIRNKEIACKASLRDAASPIWTGSPEWGEECGEFLVYRARAARGLSLGLGPWRGECVWNSWGKLQVLQGGSGGIAGIAGEEGSIGGRLVPPTAAHRTQGAQRGLSQPLLPRLTSSSGMCALLGPLEPVPICFLLFFDRKLLEGQPRPPISTQHSLSLLHNGQRRH